MKKNSDLKATTKPIAANIGLAILCALASPTFAGEMSSHITPSCMVSNEGDDFRLSLFFPISMVYQKGPSQRYYKQISCTSKESCMMVSYGASDTGMGFASLPEPLRIIRDDGSYHFKSTRNDDYTIRFSPTQRAVQVIDSGVSMWGSGIGVANCVAK